MISNPRIQNILAACGWHSARRAAVDGWITRLRQEGYCFSGKALRILEEFGGLAIAPPRSEENVYAPTKIIFNPIRAASGEFDRVDEWQDRVGRKLSPLGSVFGSGILLLGDNSRVYSICDDEFYLLGESFESAITTLVLAAAQPQLVDRLGGGVI